MKRLLMSLALILGMQAGTAFGAEFPNHIKAKGHVVFKAMAKIHHVPLNLMVPKHGKGKIFAEFHGKAIEAKFFKAFHKNGRTVFLVAFADLPGMEKGTVVVMKGTYMRGYNLAVYYGDFFFKKFSCPGGRCPGKAADPKATEPAPAPEGGIKPTMAEAAAPDEEVEIDEAMASCLEDGKCELSDEAVTGQPSDSASSDEDILADSDTWDGASCAAGDCCKKGCKDCKECKCCAACAKGGKCECKDCKCCKSCPGKSCKGGTCHGKRHHHRHHHARGWYYGGGFGFHTAAVKK